MPRFAKSLIAIFASILVVGVASAGLSLVVDYKPFGVPDARREEYEQKIAAIRHNLDQASKQQHTAKPRAGVEQTHHDFGLLDPHTTASHGFQIRNEGDAPLTLNVAETTCKCTVGKVKQGVLLPGEATEITLTWNTGYQSESYQQTALVDTNDPNRSTIELTVAGTVRADLVVPEAVRLSTADPGQPAVGSFLVHSQLHEDLIIEDVVCELDGFDWEAEPIDPSAEISLADAEAKSAWKVRVRCVSTSPGRFATSLRLTVRGDGKSLPEKTVQAVGKVHRVISFHSPDLHAKEGLRMGTLVNDQDHTFHLTVRQRSDSAKSLRVMDVRPEVLDVRLQPSRRDGDYRLTIRVPKGTPSTIFNLDTKQGYVQVGDPATPGLSNWLPLHGAIVKIQGSAR